MRDLKYLLAYTIPISTCYSIYYDGIWSYSAVIYAYLIIPIFELIFSENDHKYSAEEKSSRLKNKLFDFMLYFNIPMVFGILAWGFSDLTSNLYSFSDQLGKIISLGILLSTNGINVAHELGHRINIYEKILAKFLLIPTLYMHFFIEHNFGHHKNVATPEDPASAKLNQSLYGFWITSVIGQYISAWKIQTKLRKQNNFSFFSIKHDMIWYLLFQVIYIGLIFILFGVKGVFYASITALISVLMLETINYIEHYGLSRNKKGNRYERILPIHSWNSNHIIGRLVLYELTRHSDHHHITSKKYQILENKKESPQLPFGYPTSMIIAMIPPLWFWLINPRLKLLNNS
ncbi:MAG: alkane 1-monooxygenase [Flavobacteriaceae bacterium]|nr:alkane 1-monooxygenase [Flavobacteriaceae bacterium]|tara:strand:+ start:26966 stop:28003 length:1038 start_codon:yes stop_codon:yes gene_type:complete